MPDWPERTAICLNCRTALCDGETCDSRWHQTASLRGNEGREALLERAFPAESSLERSGKPKAPPVPRRAWPWVILFLLCAICLARWPSFLLLALGLAAAGAVARVELRRVYAARRLPRGAVREPPLLREATPIAGTVLETEQLPSPLLERPCVAFAISLEHADGDSVHTVLRDAATIGFDLETNDGQRVAIPPGRIRLAAEGERVVDHKAVMRYARALDPLGQRAKPDPFGHRVAREAVLRVGDRVLLHNHVEQTLDPETPPDGYREAAPSVLRPSGTPCIQPVRAES